MAKLENPKHEAFALYLAKGLKQGEAYVRAGYQNNPSAASRLATMPIIIDRVATLEKEIMTKMSEVMTMNSEEAARSLAEMGLTMEWVASAYKTIYEQSLQAASFAAANTAVANIQKLIEIDKAGGKVEEEDKAPLVKLSDVSEMLREARALIELGQKEGSDEPDMIDVTPKTKTPADILASRDEVDDADYSE